MTCRVCGASDQVKRWVALGVDPEPTCFDCCVWASFYAVPKSKPLTLPVGSIRLVYSHGVRVPGSRF